MQVLYTQKQVIIDIKILTKMENLNYVLYEALKLKDKDKIINYINQYEYYEDVIYKLQSECSSENNYLQIQIELLPYNLEATPTNILEVFANCIVLCSKTENLRYLMSEMKRRYIPCDLVVKHLRDSYSDFEIKETLSSLMMILFESTQL